MVEFTTKPPKITSDPTVISPNVVPNTIALHKALGNLNKNWMDVLDKLSANFTNIFSESLLSSTFTNSSTDIQYGWIYSGWESLDGSLTIDYVEGSINNFITIPNVYDSAGYYFLCFDIKELTGYLNITLNGESLRTITTTGRCGTVYPVSSSLTDTLTIQQVDPDTNGSTTILNGYLIKVSQELYDYINSQIASYFNYSDLSNYITKNDMDQAVGTILATTMQAHLAAKNPHNITPELINAAPVNHTHSQYALKTDLSLIGTYKPNTIVCNLNGNYPKELFSGYIDVPVTFITQYLNHISKTNFCLQSGTILINDKDIDCVSMIDATVPIDSRYAVIPSSKLPTVTYTFTQTRLLETINIVSNASLDTGCPLKLIVSTNGYVKEFTSVFNENISGYQLYSIPMNSISADSITVSIEQTDTTLENYTFGFDIIFADTNLNDIAINTNIGVAMRTPDNSATSLMSVISPFYFDINTLVQNHTYMVAYTSTDQETISLELYPLPYLYTNKKNSNGINVFSECTITDAYYNIPTLTNIDITENNYDIYKYNMSTSTSNILSINQVLINPLVINEITVHFNKETTNTIPNTFSIIVNYEDNTIDTFTVSTSNVSIIDGPIGYATIQSKPVSSFIISLQTDENTICDLNYINVKVNTLTYNNNKWSDGNMRGLIGYLTVLENGFQLDPIFYNDVCSLPIANLSDLEFYTYTTISNPYPNFIINESSSDDIIYYEKYNHTTKLIYTSAGPKTMTILADS